MVGKGVEANLGHLNPNLYGAPVPVLVRAPSRRLDNDNQLPGVTLQGRAQVDAYFGQSVGGGLQPDGLVHHLAAGRVRRIILIVAVTKI